MKMIFDCYPCVLRQVVSAAKLTGLNEKQTKSVIDYTLNSLQEISPEDSPQSIIVRVMDRFKKECPGEADRFDPYAELKTRSNTLVLDHYEELESVIENSSSKLEMALKMAAAGNIIDFGAKEHGRIDIEKEIQNIPLLEFSHYEFETFSDTLKNAKTILYIGDNAGEIVFDRLFIRQIKRERPEVKIYFATRSEPVINDITLEDAYQVGIDKEAEVLSSGCRYPGLILSESSEILRKLWDSADLIIAKGQGNYEGLSDEKNSRLFFILRIKCGRVAVDIGADEGSLVLWCK
jgi:uncharacterized protein with ATP-grasp and redox domains